MSKPMILTSKAAARRISVQAAHHLSDSLGFVMQAQNGLKAVQRNLRQLDEADRSLLEKRLLAPEVVEEIERELREREDLREALVVIGDKFASLRRARIDKLAEMERRVEKEAVKVQPPSPTPQAAAAAPAEDRSKRHIGLDYQSLIQAAQRELGQKSRETESGE
jgi:hypothetical protein